MMKTSSIIKYLKGRASSLGASIDYYEGIEQRGRGWLTSDQQYAYDICIARLDEIRKLIEALENGK